MNAIIGGCCPEQAVVNAQAASINLSTDELQEINRIGRIIADNLQPHPTMWD